MTQGLILFAHGARDPRWAAAFRGRRGTGAGTKAGCGSAPWPTWN